MALINGSSRKDSTARSGRGFRYTYARAASLAVSILGSAFLFAGCSAVATKPDMSSATAGHAPQDTVTNPILPNVPLTGPVLYDILLGEIAGYRGDLDVAVKSLSRAAQNTRDPRLAARATHAALYAKKHEQALETATLWAELEPENIEARETLATVLLNLDRPAEAQLHLEKVLEIASREQRVGPVFLRIASLMTRQTNRSAAYEVMQTLVNGYPQDPYAHLALAHLGVRANDFDRALEAANQALIIKPGWEEAALYKGRILVGQSNSAEALAFYEDFVKRYPRAAKVRLNYARLLVDRKQWEKARTQFKRVVDSSPDDADAIFAVGLLSVQAEHMQEAEQYLTRHLELKPDNDQARLYLGQVAENQKQFEKAVRWYKEISAPQYYFEAQTRLAIAMAKSGEAEKARKHLHAVRADSEPQRVQLVLAEEQILREDKRYHEALKVLNVALKSLPEQTDIRYARALLAEKLDMLSLLESDLRTILKKDPGNVHALNALGYTLADRTDRLQEAYQLVSQAMEQKPSDAFILDSMGWVQYRMGNYDESIRLLKEALSVRNDAEISAHLGEVLWMKGQHSEARSVWRRALERMPDNELLLGIIKKFTK